MSQKHKIINDNGNNSLWGQGDGLVTKNAAVHEVPSWNLYHHIKSQLWPCLSVTLEVRGAEAGGPLGLAAASPAQFRAEILSQGARKGVVE